MTSPAPDSSLPFSGLTPDERQYRDTVRAFADREIAPRLSAMDAQAFLPRDLLDALFSAGLMGIDLPETEGGAGRTFFHAILAIETLSQVDPGVGVVIDVQNTLVVNAIRRWGSPEQRGRFLPRLAANSVGAYALSEAGAGSDAFALTTHARAHDDHFILSGRKLWITNADEASIFIVFATVNPNDRHRGITAFIVERNTPGLQIGDRADKLGVRSASTCEVIFDDCVVPAGHVLGDVGCGYKVAIETLNEGRIGIGAQMAGLAAGALEHTLAHVKHRRQFGRPIADFQGVQFQLARAATDIEAARLLVYEAARRREAGVAFRTNAAMCKLFASEVAERVASLAVNLHGACGFVKNSPVEKLYRDAKVGQIYEGTSNLQLQTIAKHLLR